MKTKMLEIVMDDGRVFHVPAEVIAKDRAHHYGTHDPDPDYDSTYAVELKYTLSSDYELVDWYQNNMNPEDVAPFAVLVEDPLIPSFQDATADSMRVVEVEKD